MEASSLAIRALGMAYTFLRPNLFMQGLLGFRTSIVAEGRFFAAGGDAKISVVDVRDIAAVAAEALTTNGHEGRTYDVTGPEALTHTEVGVTYGQEEDHVRSSCWEVDLDRIVHTVHLVHFEEAVRYRNEIRCGYHNCWKEVVYYIQILPPFAGEVFHTHQI